QSIPIAKAMGTRVILLPFFGKWALKTQAEMDFVGDALRELAPAAEKAGVILGLEDTISARDNVRIMERSKSPAVLTYYDVGNSTQQGFDIIEEIRWLGRSASAKCTSRTTRISWVRGRSISRRSSMRLRISAMTSGLSSRRSVLPDQSRMIWQPISGTFAA